MRRGAKLFDHVAGVLRGPLPSLAAEYAQLLRSCLLAWPALTACASNAAYQGEAGGGGSGGGGGDGGGGGVVVVW